MPLLGNFLNFIFGNGSDKEVFYSYTWFQQAVGPGCSPRAAPAPGRLACASVSMGRPGHTGPPLACQGESKGPPFPRQPVTATQAWWPPTCLSSVNLLPHLSRSSLASAGEKVAGHQRVDLAA